VGERTLTRRTAASRDDVERPRAFRRPAWTEPKQPLGGRSERSKRRGSGGNGDVAGVVEADVADSFGAGPVDAILGCE
jgi:hypothetical protein